ncbi:hypothetical protein MLD38_026355 [Melastoma candidum]|uniref:Uncharacterized protein n=1 Tax=Melastoma candidum TaxID=119954 RepID=A0ACB9P1K3_9MYRT|nr:hypothetical protein MLD38_026355 [Melastoma candidum]
MLGIKRMLAMLIVLIGVDRICKSSMLDILVRSRQFETMVSLLEEMAEKRTLSMETSAIVIRAFAAAKERKKAVGVFDLMKRYKFKIGVETINCLLDALGQAKLRRKHRQYSRGWRIDLR